MDFCALFVSKGVDFTNTKKSLCVSWGMFFNQDWYTTVGYNIIEILIINAIWPPLEFILISPDSYVAKWLLKAYDQGRCCPKKKLYFLS